MTYKTAYQISRERWTQLQRRQDTQRVRPPPARVLGHGVELRPAEQVPYTPRPISILAPKADTPETVRAFVRQEFAEAQRKRERRGGVMALAYCIVSRRDQP